LIQSKIVNLIMKDFKILFFNKNDKDRFVLSKFKDNPSNIIEFKLALSNFGGFNLNNDEFITSFYKKYLNLFESIKDTNPKDYPKYYWRTKCLNIDFKSSTDEYFISRGWSYNEMQELRRQKYATGTIEFQVNKHNISKNKAKEKINRTQKKIKTKRKKTYSKYVDENPNYWKETVGYGVESLMKNKGLSRVEAISLYEKISNKVSAKNKSWAESQLENNPEYWDSRLSTQVEYWVNKGYSKEESKKIISENQATFTLEKCIKKYGKKEGTKIYNDRQEKWSSIMEEKYHDGDYTRFCKSNWSKIELEFIKNLVNTLNLSESDYYSALNGKQFFRRFNQINRTVAYDFVLDKKIIEFNGDYWHMNPKLYEANDYNKSLRKRAHEIWSYDNEKINYIKEEGYDVLVVWESDYHENPETIIEKCVQYLNNQ